MIAKVNKETKELILHYENDNESVQMNVSFTKKIRQWQFKTKGKGGWKGDVLFLKHGFKLKIGFWYHLSDICKRFRIKLKFNGLDEFFYDDITRDFVFKFMLKLANETDMELRPYQVDAVYKMYKFRFTRVDLSTSSGKTFVMLAYILLLKYVKKLNQVLIIEPDSDYVMQTYAAFDKAFKQLGISINTVMVTGNNSLKTVEGESIVIGNFQTLQHRDAAFFKHTNTILVDEGHRMVAKTIKDIMINCGHKVANTCGLSGSYIEDDTADTFELINATGPIVKRVTKKQLMDAGYAPNIKIYVLVIKYLTSAERREIARLKELKIKQDLDLYDHEIKTMRGSQLRKSWVISLMNRMEKNTLTFFSDVKTEYGKSLFNGLRNLSSTKELYYIDGSVKADTREMYKAKMEEGNNKSLVASYDTYGTGKSINNLHNLICAEPKRSEIYINQAIGRGMRDDERKEHFNWYDIVDDFRWSGKLSEEDDHIHFTNILYNQMQERIKYYIKEGFKYEIRHIDLLKIQQEEEIRTPKFF